MSGNIVARNLIRSVGQNPDDWPYLERSITEALDTKDTQIEALKAENERIWKDKAWLLERNQKLQAELKDINTEYKALHDGSLASSQSKKIIELTIELETLRAEIERLKSPLVTIDCAKCGIKVNYRTGDNIGGR